MCCAGSPTRSLQRMGTIRNLHGDSVVALDTPDGRMAVELTQPRSVGSSRHAILNLSTGGSASRRSLSQRMRNVCSSMSGASDTSLPPVDMRHHSCPSSSSCSASSGRSSGSNNQGSMPSGSSSSSEVGTATRPVRALVATFQASSEQVLLSSFMHLHISVIVEFAVGVEGLRSALMQNHKVGVSLICANLRIIQCCMQQATAHPYANASHDWACFH